MMPDAHQNFISHVQAQARIMLDQYGRLSQIDALWAGAANYDGLIDQAAIDTVPSFLESGLTQTDVADAVFILTTIRNNMTGALPALTILANLP